MHVYGKDFYDSILLKLFQDEKQIIPYVLEKIRPTSIVDFGCGEGRWLFEAKKNDANIEVLGLDGPYVSRDRLWISQDEFLGIDLRNKIELEKKYDLAISTEVAEHIEEEYIDIFLDNLAKASDCILFSASIPGQGGEYHVNEQWQSYWVKKFKDRGYQADFSIRNYFWNNEDINAWRRQNILMFFKNGRETVNPEIIDVVHPGIMEHCLNRCQRRIEGIVEYMFRNPEITESIRQSLKLLVEQEKKIILYPYGNTGRLSELMLACMFHYDKFLIVDNKLGGSEEKILTFDRIPGEWKDAVILDVCFNTNVHQELLEEVKKSAAEMERVTVFKI